MTNSGGSSEDRRVIFCMTALGLSALFVGIYTGVEIYMTSFGTSNSNRDAETTGTAVRKSFLIAISTASFARVIAVTALAVYYYNQVTVTTDASKQSPLIEMLRYMPSCIYVTVYTMVTVYFAQMCYTVSVNSVSYSQLRSMFFVGNVLTYGTVIFFIAVRPVNYAVYWVFLVSYSVTFLSTLFYGYSLFKLLPGSTAHHQRTARKVMARFVPLLIICLTGLLFGTVHFFYLVISVQPITSTISQQFEFDFIAFTLSEILPSLLVILLLAKKSSTGSTAPSEGTGLVPEPQGSDLLHIIKGYISSKYLTIPSTEQPAVESVGRV